MRKIVALLAVLALPGFVGIASAGVSVEDAVVCTSIVERSPDGTATNVPPDVGRVYAFTKVVGMETPGSVTHRWRYGGEIVAEVPLEVGSPSWRTWSSKEIMPHQTGDWEVEVLDGGGAVLHTLGFTVGVAGAEAEKKN